MDDLTLRYYEAEMRYLREAGKEFARAHPDRAAMLNLDKTGARDPYVERLFEGFAFLMGRLREKLDDDLPELTEGLVSLLWPHYMRTIPSLSVVAFTPDWRQLRKILLAKSRESLSLWSTWLTPLPTGHGAGDDPTYEDDFQLMREEINKLSGTDTDVLCRLAESILTRHARDIRVVT